MGENGYHLLAVLWTYSLVPFITRSLELSPISWKEECSCLSDEALWLVPGIPRLHESLLIRVRVHETPFPTRLLLGWWPGGSTEEETLVPGLPEVCARRSAPAAEPRGTCRDRGVSRNLMPHLPDVEAEGGPKGMCLRAHCS